MHLSENEICLEGKWLEQDTGVVGDEACKRIHWLIENSFNEISRLNWEIIYQDKKDKRFWLLTYPQSHLHGGGPPSIKFITKSQANEKIQNSDN